VSRNLKFQDLLHRQIYEDVKLDRELNKVADIAGGRGGLLGDLDPHSDTMFNPFQLRRLVEELAHLLREQPELEDDVCRLQEMAHVISRRGGYFWIVGD
jgi:hypothetical protein